MLLVTFDAFHANLFVIRSMRGMRQAHVDHLVGPDLGAAAFVGGEMVKLRRREVEHFHFTAEQNHRVEGNGDFVASHAQEPAIAHDDCRTAVQANYLLDVTEDASAFHWLEHRAMNEITDAHWLWKALRREAGVVGPGRGGLLCLSRHAAEQPDQQYEPPIPGSSHEARSLATLKKVTKSRVLARKVPHTLPDTFE